MISNLVSTIIPVFNRPAQIREAVTSVLVQDHACIEVLIVDDGSTDDTLAVARALAAESPETIQVFPVRNGGPGLAREFGRRHARGEFIQYLDSDDVLLPGKFSAQVRALRDHPECHVAYGRTRFRDIGGTRLPGPWKESGVVRGTMFPSFLGGRWWDTPTPLYRASICDQAGSWTDLRAEEDWEYDCRIASLGVRLVWCDRDVCEVRDHAGDRLCRGAPLDPLRLQQRARSHALILGHAQRARIPATCPEMQHFARTLFHLARQCGAAGLSTESERLFALAQQASGPERAAGSDFALYRALSRLVGWRTTGWLSCQLDRLRKHDG